MREFRKKQKTLKRIMNICVIFTAIFFFVYIGVEPVVADNSNTLAIILGYTGDVLLCYLATIQDMEKVISF